MALVTVTSSLREDPLILQKLADPTGTRNAAWLSSAGEVSRV
ncbi:MAG: hypothetical protein RIE06_28820 [Roseibium album]